MTQVSFDIPPISQPRAASKIEEEIAAGIRGICARFNVSEERINNAVEILLRNPRPVSNPSQLPEFAPEIYSNRPRIFSKSRRENIVEFLGRVWKPWIEAGLLARADLRKFDPSADKAVENWIRKQPLPSDLPLPSYPRRPCSKLSASRSNLIR